MLFFFFGGGGGGEEYSEWEIFSPQYHGPIFLGEGRGIARIFSEGRTIF